MSNKEKGPGAFTPSPQHNAIRPIEDSKKASENQGFIELEGDARSTAVALIEGAMAGAAAEGVTVTISYEGAPSGCANVAVAVDRRRRVELAVCGWQPTLRMPAGELWQIINRLNNTDYSVEEVALALADPKEARQLLRSKDEREATAEDLMHEFRERMEMCEALLERATDPTQLVGGIPRSAVILARSKGGAR